MSCSKNKFCEDLFAKPKYGPKVKAWDNKRRQLLDSISRSDLHWTKWPLRDNPKQSMKDAPYTIEVCRPVAKSGFFIPVTADETFCIASKWRLFPLTSAVMDQTAFTSNYVSRKIMSNQVPEIYDFETYSKYLKGTLYARAVCVGAHKVWVISGKGRRINYGFHFREAGRTSNKYYGNGWRVIQSEGSYHEGDQCHWDYSQLLQFMRNLKTKSGKVLDIGSEIKAKNPALWYPSFGDPKRLP